MADFFSQKENSILSAQLSLATAAWNHVLALHTSEFERRESINSSSILIEDPTTRAWHERSRRLVAQRSSTPYPSFD